jgi:hypothetical protein
MKELTKKPTTPKHFKVRWSCALCDDIVYSDTREHHKMDFCRCGKTGVDLEIYLTRRMGTPKTWEIIKDKTPQYKSSDVVRKQLKFKKVTKKVKQ